MNMDESYWIPACATIASLLANANKNTSYEIHIIYSGDVLARMEKPLAQILKKVSGKHTICFALASELKIKKINEDLIGWPEITFCRLYIANYLQQYERCLYLDVDIVVQDDLTELFETKLGDAYFAGVKDQWVQEHWKSNNPIEHMGIEDISGYINSGVLVFDLKKIRRDNMVQRFVETIDNRLEYADQGILNYCCYGKIKHLPIKYNFSQNYYGYYERISKEVYSNEELEGVENPIIIHYGGVMKPWNHIRISGGEEWWKYLDYFMTDGEKVQYRRTIQEKNPYEIWTKIIDICHSKQTVVIFGCGKLGKQLADELLNNRITNIGAFGDNNVSAGEYREIPIKNVKQCLIDYSQASWIISSPIYAKEMKNQLLALGVRAENILEYGIRTPRYMRMIQKELFDEEVEHLIHQALGKECKRYERALDKINSLSLEERDRLEKVYDLSQWMIIK